MLMDTQSDTCREELSTLIQENEMKTTEQMIQALEVLGYTVRPPMTDKQVLDEWARMNFAPAPPADTKHKWHDAIVAWAEGKPVQYRTKSGKNSKDEQNIHH